MTTMLPAYYQKIVNENYKQLSHEEVVCLILKYKAGERKALGAIINSYMRLIVSVAKSYQDSQSSLEDCIQEATLCFPKAIMDFDTTLGYKFHTFLTARIRAQIQVYVYQNDIVRIPMNHVKAKEVRDENGEVISAVVKRTKTHSIHNPVSADSTTTFEDTLVADDDFEKKFVLKDHVKKILKSIDRTTPQWQMFDMYYGISGDKYTMEVISQQFRCKKQNVDYHIKKVLKQLRIRNQE